MVKPNYRVLLCRYNEIGLKSLPYQQKLITILVNSIKKICIREGLNLQSALILEGRLLFFFPTDQIPKAITVFRHIIGLQSLSPAISVERKYEKLKRSVIEFATTILNSNDSFKIDFKTVVSYPIKSSQVKNDLNASIIQKMTESGKNVIVKRKNPLVKISIEIREKGTYIYARTIPTLFSGFPIETKNALICPWSENPSILVAAMMLVRRGSIVSPVIFVNKTLMELKERSNIPQKLQNSLKNLAKFYSAAIPVHIFSLSSLIIQIKKNIPQNHEFQIYIDFACMKILEIMIIQSREQSSYLFDGRKLHYKGLISSYPYSESKKNSVDYDIETLKLTPLFGISSELVQKCESQLYSTSKPFEMRKLEQQIIDVFSFNSEIIKSLNFKENRKNRKNGIISLKSNKIVSNRLELYEFYEISENKNLLHEIIKHHKVEYVSGKIFPSQI